MGCASDAKWSAARTLHEDYGVDQRIIACATGTTSNAIRRRAEMERWGPSALVPALHIRLLKLVQAQLERIQESDESIEKAARATAVVAKIVQDAFDSHKHDREEAVDEQHPDSKGGDWRTDFFAKVEEAARAECAG